MLSADLPGHGVLGAERVCSQEPAVQKHPTVRKECVQGMFAQGGMEINAWELYLLVLENCAYYLGAVHLPLSNGSFMQELGDMYLNQ